MNKSLAFLKDLGLGLSEAVKTDFKKDPGKYLNAGANIGNLCMQNKTQNAQIEVQKAVVEQGEVREGLQQSREAYFEAKTRLNTALRNGSWGPAVTACNEAIRFYKAHAGTRQMSPTELDVLHDLYYYGVAASLKSHQLDKANEYIDLYLEGKNPTLINCGWHLWIAKVRFIEGKFDDAIAHIRQMLEKNPSAEHSLIANTILTVGQFRNVIDLVGEWEASSAHAPAIDLLNHNQRPTTGLEEFDLLILLKACAYLKGGLFLNAAQYFSRAIKYIQLTSEFPEVSHLHEIKLLYLFSSIALSLQLVVDHQVPNEHLLAKLREVDGLFQQYRKKLTENDTKTSLSYTNSASEQYRCFASATIFKFVEESLAYFCVPGRLDQFFHNDIHRNDSEVLKEIVSVCTKCPTDFQSVLNTAFCLLKKGFMLDSYEPANLMLLSAFSQSQEQQMKQLANLAKTNLAYCHIHAFRIERKIGIARKLAKEAGLSNSRRASGELGYMFWHGLGVEQNYLVAEFLLLRKNVIDDDMIENKRLLAYLAIMAMQNNMDNLLSNDRIIDQPLIERIRNFNKPHLETLTTLANGPDGMVFAKAWLANIYAFGLFCTACDEDKASGFIKSATAVAKIFNKPDFFFAKIIKYRMIRDGKGFEQDLELAFTHLSEIERMGSSAAMLEIATLQNCGYLQLDGTLTPLELRNGKVSEDHRIDAINNIQKFNISPEYHLGRIDEAITFRSQMCYAMSAYHGMWGKKRDISLAKNLFIQLAKVAKQLTDTELNGSLVSTVYYYLGLLYIFCKMDNLDDQAKNAEAIRYINTAHSGPRAAQASQLVKSRVLARLGIFHGQAIPENIQNAHRALNLIPHYQPALRTSVTCNTQNKIMLMFSDSSGEIRLCHGDYQPNQQSPEIEWKFPLKRNIFSRDCSHPKIVVNNTGFVVAVATNRTTKMLQFKCGQLQADHHINWTFEEFHSGSTATVALTQDRIIEMHCHENGGNLYYRIAPINAERMRWSNPFRHRTFSRSIANPAIAVNGDRVALVYERDNQICLEVGTLVQNQINWFRVAGQNHVWVLEEFNDCKSPSIMISDENNFILLCAANGNQDDSLYSAHIRINLAEKQVLNKKAYDVGHCPSATLIGDHILSFHDFGQICRKDLTVEEIIVATNQNQQATRENDQQAQIMPK